MNTKHLSYLFIAILIIGYISSGVNAAGTTVEASLNINTPPAQVFSRDTQLSELARVDIYAALGDLYLQGIQLGADSSSGLQNFANIVLYKGINNAVLGEYPSQQTPNTIIRFPFIIIGYQQTRTFYIRGTPTSSASGTVRVGFQNLIFANSESVTQSKIPIYGNVITLPGATPTPTPTPTPIPTPTPTLIPSIPVTPTSKGFTNLSALDLKEGDTVSAIGSNDPDIYIANSWGYKRLFLNPVIFNFYGHLGGFSKVKSITPSTRTVLVTSGLVRNCEINDPKVYGVETTGEDTGKLHWVNTTGDQAVQDDPEFFKKVFCINSNEFNWYAKGPDYTSVNQVPLYTR